MKADIHPAYYQCEVVCSCGHTFTVGTTLSKASLSLDVCSKCHPFYTKKQDTSGRVSGRLKNFREKYGWSSAGRGADQA